jgi:hypothetical protein
MRTRRKNRELDPEIRPVKAINSLDAAIDVAEHYSSTYSIRIQNHLNSHGAFSTCDLQQIAALHAELKSLYRYLCHLTHSIVTEQSFDVENNGIKYKVTAKEQS